jgi:DNA-binding LytR/AlgR family response regulator
MNEDKIKCVIVEDEKMATKLLVSYVGEHGGLDLVATYTNPSDFMKEKDRLEFDLLFLDVLMPKMTGVELLRHSSLSCEVIITSAMQDYALECYPLNVVDYLLKPFSLTRFREAVTHAAERIDLKRKQLEKMPVSNRTHMLLKVDKRLIKVKIADILYVEAAWEYAKIYTKDQCLVILSQIKHLEQELEASSFFRIHRSFLINLDHVSYIEGNQICIGKAKLPVSRNYKSELLRKLGEL